MNGLTACLTFIVVFISCFIRIASLHDSTATKSVSAVPIGSLIRYQTAIWYIACRQGVRIYDGFCWIQWNRDISCCLCFPFAICRGHPADHRMYRDCNIASYVKVCIYSYWVSILTNMTFAGVEAFKASWYIFCIVNCWVWIHGFVCRWIRCRVRAISYISSVSRCRLGIII